MKNSIIKFKHSIIALLMIVLNGAGAYASAPWTVNPGDYRYDMSLYLDVSFASAGMDYSRYEVGVFSGDECRGIAEVLPLDGGKECLYLRARSNVESGEMMTFRYFDKETDEIQPVDGVSFQFASNGRLGYPSEPYLVRIIRHYDVGVSAGDGGTVDIEGGRIAEGTMMTITASPSEGHHFEQWSDGSTDNPRTVIVEGDLTLNAEFGVNSYKLVYMVDGAQHKELDVDYGSAITPEAFPEKEGHTFSGWEGLPETMPARDVTATGTFTVNSYTAVFKVGDEVVWSGSVTYGEPVVAPEAPEKEGHTFDGWSDVPATMPARDIEISGSYTVNLYRLTYVVDGSTYKETEVSYGSAIVPETPEKEGHTFSGWEGLPETMPARDVTASGTFTVNSYTAVFKVGDEVVWSGSVTYGEPVVAPEAPEKEGHTFDGWSDVPATMPARDIEISGSYTVNLYHLTYVVDGSTYKDTEVPYGTAITPEAFPEKEGHTFSGWEGLPETMPARDVTATGTFTVNSYTAVFKVGDEVVWSGSVTYGEPVVAPEAPEKEGHTFDGWSDVPATMPARDIEISGSYTVNLYHLTYVVDGSTYKETEVPYGSAIVPETPEKEGHTFSGWEGLPETMPARDVTATGTFTVNSYTAVFKVGDEVVWSGSVTYGEPVVAPEAPEKEGHTFDGWSDVPATMPARDIEISGSYTVNLYHLTYVVDGSTYKETEVPYGSAIVPETPEKEGHTFFGWEGLPETMPARDVTATGTFTVNSYTAVFRVGDEVVWSGSVTYGEPVVAPEAPEKEGHMFDGWSDVPATMPARDIEISGSYTVNLYHLTYVVDGSTYKDTEVPYGTAIVPETPEKEGHTFSGWEGLPETMPAYDVTATGTFSVNSYKLSLYLNNELYHSEMIEFGTPIAIEDPDIPEGMKFDGWIDEIPESMPARDVDIHGAYSAMSSISITEMDDEQEVTICDLNGLVLFKNVVWQEARGRLGKGFYIINGKKYLIGK